MFECLFFLRNRFQFSLSVFAPLTSTQQIKEEISNKNSVLRILKADGGQTESVTCSLLKLFFYKKFIYDKIVCIFRLVLKCLLLARKEKLTGILTGLTGQSKNLDPIGRSTRPISISAPNGQPKTNFLTGLS